jgi:glutaredoxin
MSTPLRCYTNRTQGANLLLRLISDSQDSVNKAFFAELVWKQKRKENLEKEMAINANGFSKPIIVEDTTPAKDWHNNSAISFDLQLLNATRFEQLLAIKAPPTPITAAVYEAYGYPFHEHYIESGELEDDESYADKYSGLWTLPVVLLNEDDAKASFPSVIELEAALAELRSAESAEDGEGI